MYRVKDVRARKEMEKCKLNSILPVVVLLVFNQESMGLFLEMCMKAMCMGDKGQNKIGFLRMVSGK